MSGIANAECRACDYSSCVASCKDKAALIATLKAEVEADKSAARPGSPLPCGHAQRLAFYYDHHGKKIDCLMCLVKRLTEAATPLAQCACGKDTGEIEGILILHAEANFAQRAVKSSEVAQAHFAQGAHDSPNPNMAQHGTDITDRHGDTEA